MKRKVNTLQGFKKGGKKQDWVSEKISMLMKEGKPQDQAIAMALSMWGQKHEDGGYQLPMYQIAGTAGTIDPNFQFKNTLNTTKGFPQMTTGFTTPMPSSSTTPSNEYQDYFKNKSTEYQGSNWNLKEDSSKQKQQRDQATQTINSWQTPQLYSGMDIATSANIAGQGFGEGDFLKGIAGTAKTLAAVGRSFGSGLGTGNRKEYAMQDASNKLKNSAKGVDYAEAFANGGHYNQGSSLPAFQDAGMYYNRDWTEEANGDEYSNYDGYQPDMINKYQLSPAYNFDQNYETGDTGTQLTQIEVGKKIIPQGKPFDPNSARDLWTDYTGLSWAEAKKRGYTDGSAKANMALLDRLRKESVASVLENKPKRASTRVARAAQNRAQPTQQEQPQQQAVTPRPRVAPTQQVVKKRYNSPNPLGNIYRNMEESEGKFAPADTDNRSRGAKIKDAINNQIRTFGYQLDFENGGYFQDGGMQPGPEEQMEGQMSNPQEEGTEQQGGDQMQQMAQEVEQVLQQAIQEGKEKEVAQQLVQQLVQMGLPEDQAAQLVQYVLEKLNSQQQMPASPQLRHGGYYQEGGIKTDRFNQEQYQRGLDKQSSDAMEFERRTLNSKNAMDQDRIDSFIKANLPNQAPLPPSFISLERNPLNSTSPTEQNWRNFHNNLEEKQKGYYQEGGEQYRGTMGQPQEAPSNQGGDIMAQIQKALQDGHQESELIPWIMQQYQISEGEATQMIEGAKQGLGAQPMMQNGGEYLKNLKGKTIKNYTYNSKTGNYDVEFE